MLILLKLISCRFDVIFVPLSSVNSPHYFNITNRQINRFFFFVQSFNLRFDEVVTFPLGLILLALFAFH